MASSRTKVPTTKITPTPIGKVLSQKEVEENLKPPISKIEIPGHDTDFEDVVEDVEFVDIPIATIKSNIKEIEPESEFLEIESEFIPENNGYYPSVANLLHNLAISKTPKKIIQQLTPLQIDALAAIFTFNFTTKFTCKLPKGFPPKYQTKRYENVNNGNLFKETDKFCYLIAETNLPIPRKYVRNRAMTEAILEEWLETLNPLDVEVVIATKDRELEQKYGITLKLVAELFPQLVERF